MGCCTWNLVLPQECWIWSIVLSQGAAHRAQYSHRVLHTEHSPPAECCTQNTVLSQGSCTQSIVLLEACWTWSTSVLIGCFTQITVDTWGAAHRTQYSHRVLHMEHGTPTGVLDVEYSVFTGCYTQSTVPLQSAAHRTQYSHRVLHTKHSTPTGCSTWNMVLRQECWMWSIVFSQGATHRAQSPCRVLHTEHSTPTGVLPWSTVLPHSAACRARSSCSASTERHTPGVSGRGSSSFTVTHSVGSGSSPSRLVSSYLFCDFPLL